MLTQFQNCHECIELKRFWDTDELIPDKTIFPVVVPVVVIVAVFVIACDAEVIVHEECNSSITL